jgi:hypothetical protein
MDFLPKLLVRRPDSGILALTELYLQYSEACIIFHAPIFAHDAFHVPQISFVLQRDTIEEDLLTTVANSGLLGSTVRQLF